MRCYKNFWLTIFFVNLVHYSKAETNDEDNNNVEVFPWVTLLNRTYIDQLNNFINLEYIIQKHCKHKQKTRIYDIPRFFHRIDDCSTINICNQTDCLVLDPETRIFGEAKPWPDEVQIETQLSDRETLCRKPFNTTRSSTIIEIVDICYPNFTTRRTSVQLLSNLEQLTNLYTPSVNLDYISQPSMVLPDKTQEDKLYSNKQFAKFSINQRYGSCENSISNILIEEVEDLPTGCYEIRLSNNASQIRYSRYVQLHAKLMKRQNEWCNIKRVKNSRIERGVLRNRTAGILRFNLPGYRYCGPGTDIEKMDDLGGPINSLDAACRTHDIKYTMYMNVVDADEELLEAVWNTGSLYYPLFRAVFVAKYYFEYATGETFTSSLYHIPDSFQPSLTLKFHDTSVYDELNLKLSQQQINEGKRLDENWKTIVEDIWMGTCSRNKLRSDYSPVVKEGTPSLPLHYYSTAQSISNTENNPDLQHPNYVMTGNRVLAESKILQSWTLHTIDRTNLFQSVFNINKATFCQHCYSLGDFLFRLNGTTTSQIISDLRSCLSITYCPDQHDCSYKRSKYSTSNEFLSLFISNYAFYRDLELNYTALRKHCRAVIDILIFMPMDTLNLDQFGYDLKFCITARNMQKNSASTNVETAISKSKACGIDSAQINDDEVSSFTPYDLFSIIFLKSWIVDIFNETCLGNNVTLNVNTDASVSITLMSNSSDIYDFLNFQLPVVTAVKSCKKLVFKEHVVNVTEWSFLWPNETIPTRRRRNEREKNTNVHFITDEFQYPIYEHGCFFVVNEFSTAVPATWQSEFLEIRKGCPYTNRLSEKNIENIWALFVTAFPFNIVTIINYNGLRITKKGGELLYTVGSAGVNGIDIDFGSPAVQHLSENNFDVFPDGNQVPVGIFLLQTKGKVSSKLKLPVINKKKQPLPISDALKDFIKNNKVDCVFYTAQPRYDDCSVFIELCPEIKRIGTNHYIQRDWDDNNDPDYSISRCVTHILPYDPFGFKITLPTPGNPNTQSCNQGINFILSDNINYLPLVPDSNPPLQDDNQVPCSSTSLPREVYEAVPITEYRGLINRRIGMEAANCDEANAPNSKLAMFMTGLNELQALGNERTNDTNGPYVWNKGVDMEMYNHVRTHQSQYINPELLKDPSIRWWVGLIPNTDPSKCRLYCKICLAGKRSNTLVDRQNSNAITPLMTTEGMLFTGNRAQYFNSKALKHHPHEIPHSNFVDFAQETANKEEFNKRKDLKQAYLDNLPPLERHYKSTENFMRAGVGHLKSNGALTRWGNAAKNLDSMGINMGFLYQNLRGIRKLLHHISNYELKELLGEMIPGNPVSIFMDAYTDQQGRAYLGIFFFMMYKGNPEAKFYRAEEVGMDTSAEGYFQTFVNAIRKDDTVSNNITNILQANIIALSADGASVNQGHVRSIHTKLNTWLGRKVPFIWCYAHRTNLVLQPLKNDAAFVHFREIVLSLNKLHVFFGPTTKRRAKLTVRIKAMGSRVKFLEKTQTTRWAASYEKGIAKSILYWFPIYQETMATLADPSTTAKGKESATEVKNIILSPHYVTGSCWMWGVLKEFMIISKANQWENSPAIDQAFTRDRLLATIRRMRASVGGHCIETFRNFRCNGVPETQEVTLQDIETRVCRFHGVELQNPLRFDKNIHFLSELRPRMVRLLIERTNKYFPEIEQKMYQIFNPRSFPRPPGDDDENESDEDMESNPNNLFQQTLDEYGIIGMTNYFTELAKTLGYEGEENLLDLHREFTQVISYIVRDPLFDETSRTVKPSQFWNNALEDNDIPWTERIKEFVSKVTVIPSGVSEVERLFSEITALIGKDRGSLYQETIDHLLRLKHTVPDDVTQWEPFYHVIAWLEAGHCRTDDVSCKSGYRINNARQPPNVDNTNNEQQQENAEGILEDENEEDVDLEDGFLEEELFDI